MANQADKPRPEDAPAKAKVVPWGVHPETGKRHGVSRDGLRDEFGREKGERLYQAVAVAGKFLDPAKDGIYPNLDLISLETFPQDIQRMIAAETSDTKREALEERLAEAKQRKAAVDKLIREAEAGK